MNLEFAWWWLLIQGPILCPIYPVGFLTSILNRDEVVWDGSIFSAGIRFTYFLPCSLGLVI